MDKCVVLGGNGFIGSHLVDSLVERGYHVRAFDRFSGKRRFESDNVEIVAGNYLNKGDLAQAIDGMDYVFHFISSTTPATAENDPTVDIETNIRTSVDLFGMCAAKGVKRLVYASSGGSIYGESDAVHHETDPTLPVSPYAIGKLTAENYLRYFRVKQGLDSVSFRISNPYGERQALGARQGVIPIFIENIIGKKPVMVYGDGSMVRDYIYVKDVANIVADMFNRNLKYDTYNLGSGESESINDILKILSQMHDGEIAVEHKDVPSTFLHKVLLNTDRLKEELPGLQLTSLQDGVQQTYDYIRRRLQDA